MTITRKTHRTRTSLLLAGAAATAFATSADARELRYAIGWPAGAMPTEVSETVADKIEEASGGEVTMKVYPLSLLNFLESVSGVRDGIADVSIVLNPYFLSEFPATNFITELASLSELVEGDPDRMPFAFTGAIMEYAMLNCDSCAKEIAAQNQLYIGAGATPPYLLQCTKPVTTKADLEGTRIRAGGAFWNRWIAAMGATPVSISVNETFEALNQGVIDCTASSASELTNFSFIDVVTDVTTGVPGSSFSSSMNINLDTWRSLDDAGRTAVLRGGAETGARITWGYWNEARENVGKAEERGITFHEAEAGLAQESRSWIEADVDDMITTYTERGVENGAETVQSMRDLMEKWVGLVAEVDIESPEAMADLYWDEIMSKVDVSTYGM